jgi:chemotaxis protein CheD
VDDGAIEIGIAEYAVTPSGEELSTFGLGSCVAVALYEPDSGVSALAHVYYTRTEMRLGTCEKPPELDR